jgi:hypothetical protein
MYLYYRKLILTFIYEVLNKDPINFDKTEVRKRCDSDSGLFYYLKYDHFIDKTDKNGYIGRCYRTCQVDRSINYEDAKDKSISFRYDMKKYGTKINSELVSKEHLNFGDKDNVHSGLMIWSFSDDSNISEWVEFTKTP